MDTTHDGVEIVADLRVFTNDWEWGTVDAAQFQSGGLTDPGGPYFDGWYRVALDCGATKIYNGERMTTKQPS